MLPNYVGIVYILNSYQQKMTQNQDKSHTQIHKVRKITEEWSQTKD